MRDLRRTKVGGKLHFVGNHTSIVGVLCMFLFGLELVRKRSKHIQNQPTHPPETIRAPSTIWL